MLDAQLLPARYPLTGTQVHFRTHRTVEVGAIVNASSYRSHELAKNLRVTKVHRGHAGLSVMCFGVAVGDAEVHTHYKLDGAHEAEFRLLPRKCPTQRPTGEPRYEFSRDDHWATCGNALDIFLGVLMCRHCGPVLFQEMEAAPC